MTVRTEAHPTPSPKLPEHHSTDKARPTKEDKIDAQMEDSFPASDPPSYSGGNHTIGAPAGRESDAPTPDAHAVVEAEKKVMGGKAKEPGKY